MTDSNQLLRRYAQEESEEAFRQIVERYIDLVFSTALRRTNGDVHLAQDVTQTVFIGLGQKARSLQHSLTLGGWLHRHTCFVASTLVRTERRRQEREKLAAEMNHDHSDPI
jgi:RNA polymerase sigma factor (sigma-70 family)